MYYNTDVEMSPQDIWDAAERCNNIERLFNIREGFERDDITKGDWLADRYFDEPCLKGAPDVIGSKLDRKKFREMINEFYRYHGWDDNGHPTPETLKRLDLDNEPSHLL